MYSNRSLNRKLLFKCSSKSKLNRKKYKKENNDKKEANYKKEKLYKKVKILNNCLLTKFFHHSQSSLKIWKNELYIKLFIKLVLSIIYYIFRKITK